jgi:hypothetical protein
MPPVGEISRIEFELTRWFKRGEGFGLVVQVDVDSHRGSSSSFKMRHFTWSGEVSPGYSV